MVDLRSESRPDHPFLAVHYFANKTPDAPFLVSEQEVISYSVGSDRIKITAAALAKQGVSKGDVVATKLSAELEIYALHALYLLGAVSCYVARASTIPPEWEFTHVLTDEQPRVPHSEAVIRLDQLNVDTVQAVQQFLFDQVETSPHEPCRFILTSGTTGLPKAAVLSNQLIIDLAKRPVDSEQLIAPREDAFDSMISLMSMGSVLTFRILLAHLRSGIAFPIYDNKAKEILKYGNEVKNVAVLGSPKQIDDFAEQIKLEIPSGVPGVEKIVVVGTVPTPELINQCALLFPHARVFSRYGSTEVGAVAEGEVPNEKGPGYVGTVLPGVQCQIVDDTGTELPDGQEGIIRVKREHMVTEYRYDVFETARAFMRGWFYPGDLGYKTSDGQLFLTGRQTDLINLGGVKISPHPVEGLVSALEGIQEAVGFESKDPDGNSHFTLAVVSEEKVDLKRLDALVKTYISVNYPTRYIQLKELPRNENGKVQRAHLQANQTI